MGKAEHKKWPAMAEATRWAEASMGHAVPAAAMPGGDAISDTTLDRVAEIIDSPLEREELRADLSRVVRRYGWERLATLLKPNDGFAADRVAAMGKQVMAAADAIEVVDGDDIDGALWGPSWGAADPGTRRKVAALDTIRSDPARWQQFRDALNGLAIIAERDKADRQASRAKAAGRDKRTDLAFLVDGLVRLYAKHAQCAPTLGPIQSMIAALVDAGFVRIEENSPGLLRPRLDVSLGNLDAKFAPVHFRR